MPTDHQRRRDRRRSIGSFILACGIPENFCRILPRKALRSELRGSEDCIFRPKKRDIPIRILVAILITFHAISTFAATPHLSAKQSLSVMDCGDRLVTIVHPASLADTWLHRWLLRKQNSLSSQQPTSEFESVFLSPTFNAERATALATKIKSIWRHELKEDGTRSRDQQARLVKARFSAIASYLSARGAGTTLFTHARRSPWLLVLPGGGYPLGQDALKLYNQYGTLIVVNDDQYSRYSPEENILYLPWPIALAGQLGSRERQLIERIQSHFVPKSKSPMNRDPRSPPFCWILKTRCRIRCAT